MSVSSKKNLFLALGCVAGLFLAQCAQAQVGVVTPVAVSGTPTPIGDTIVTEGGIFYDNTTPSGFYFAPPAGANPVIVSDDMHWTGAYHVNAFQFGYASNVPGAAVIDIDIIFYGALDDMACPTGDPVAAFSFTGLPGVDDQGNNAYTVDVDLAGQGLDFDYTGSTLPDGTPLTWWGLLPHTNGAGPILASGGGSADIFESNKDLNTFADGCFFYFFGGPPNPEGSFHMQLTGSAL